MSAERLRLPPPLPFFFFNDTATTEIYTLSLHDALPISKSQRPSSKPVPPESQGLRLCLQRPCGGRSRMVSVLREFSAAFYAQLLALRVICENSFDLH